MDTVIWASKSLYKMIIALILIEIMGIDPNTAWYDILIISTFAASVFSSLPQNTK